MLQELMHNLEWSPRFDHGRLSNHLSMALIALERMGAERDRLRAFYAHYSPRLDPLPPANASVDPTAWPSLRGTGNRVRDLMNCFDDMITRRGPESVVGEVYDGLPGGLGSEAFHCLIRTAYALECGTRPEIAMALAYTVSAHQALPGFDPAATATIAPQDILTSLNRSRAGRATDGSNIVEKMVTASEEPGFASLVNRAPLSLQQLASIAIDLYRTGFDFTALHAVTGCHALRLVLGLTDRPEVHLRDFWYSLCAAYASIGSPPIEPPALLDGDSAWQDLLGWAIASDDEHDIKIMYTLWQEYLFYGDSRYIDTARRLAAR